MGSRRAIAPFLSTINFSSNSIGTLTKLNIWLQLRKLTRAIALLNVSFMQTQSTSQNAFLEPLVLIAPFFLWGTAMVAMKGVIPHSTPLFMAGFSPRSRRNSHPRRSSNLPTAPAENLASLAVDRHFCPLGWVDVSRLFSSRINANRGGFGVYPH